MAITRSQQAKQMLQEGGRIGLQGGGKDMGTVSAGKGISPGRSQAQFGHAGHAGKTEDQAKSDQRLGNDRPESGPGSDPFAGHNQAEKKGFQKQQEINKQIQEGTFEPPKKKSFIESFNEKKRKKNQEYLRNLRNKKFEGIAAAYGLSTEQMQKLLDAYNEDEDEFNLSEFREIVGAGAPPSELPSDPNFLKAQELALSKGMAKGNKLSTGALFSTTDPTTRIDLPGILGKVQGPETFSNVLSGLNRIQTLDEIINNPKGVTQSDIDNYFNLTMGKGGTDPVTGDTVDALFSDQTGGRDDTPMDPCKGPNPPAYCFIGDKADDTQEDVITRNLAGLTPRIGGSMFDFTGMAEGGIAGMDREAFLLGGIAKGLKKAVRGVKKLAKSPIGKAALLASPFLLKKGLFSSLIGQKAMTQAPFAGGTGLMGLFEKGLKFAKANPFKTIGGISLLSGLMTPKQDDDEFDLASYYAQNQLEPSQSIRGMGSEFDFYGGERMRVADGGDVEPVAKKTMPLLDMDGKEKDYRETGGFVDMGRMERADDVPARLSKNEFVFTADAVRNAGEGDIDKGAEVMYNMMKNLEAGGEVSEESQGLEGARKMFQTSQRLGEVI